MNAAFFQLKVPARCASSSLFSNGRMIYAWPLRAWARLVCCFAATMPFWLKCFYDWKDHSQQSVLWDQSLFDFVICKDLRIVGQRVSTGTLWLKKVTVPTCRRPSNVAGLTPAERPRTNKTTPRRNRKQQVKCMQNNNILYENISKSLKPWETLSTLVPAQQLQFKFKHINKLLAF